VLFVRGRRARPRPRGRRCQTWIEICGSRMCLRIPMIASSTLGQGTCKESVGASAAWLKLLSQSPARTRAMLSAMFADQQPSQTFYKKSNIRPLAKTPRQKKFGGRPLPANVALRHDRGGPRKVAQCKNRGKLKSVRATSGASRPLARTASTPDSKVSGPLAATARTPDSKVTRQQASSKQCAGKRKRARDKLARKQAARLLAARLAAEGAEGACQETDAEHWQRHSLVPRAERTVCCRCNFIKRKMEIKRDFPWCAPRPQLMGGPWRLGCHTCSWAIATLPGEMPGRRGREWRAGRFARYDFVFHGEWWQVNWLLKQHANESGHRAATLCHSGC